MAAYSFDGSTSVVTPTFNPAADTVALGVTPAQIANFTQSGANVVVSLKNGATLTLTGTTLAALASTNFALSGGGQVLIGDNTNQTGNDQFGNIITGTTNGDVVLGLGGADTITALAGDNLVFGGSGGVDSTDAGDTITAGTGNDTLVGNGGNDSIDGGGGSDLIYGGAGSDRIGTAGAYTVAAGQTSSIFGGGSGVDVNDAADTISGAVNNGTLVLFGNGGADTIQISSGSGAQTVYGGVGNDSITVGSLSPVSGTTVVYGGEDSDTIVVNQTAAGNATVFGGISGSDSVDGADSISVDGGRSTVFANAGADTVTITNAVNSTVYAGIGNDTVAFGVSNTATVNGGVVYGGAGNDQITITSIADQTVTVYGGDGISSPTDGNDLITGGAGNELVYANAGNDTILSGAGNDTIFAGNGDDLFRVTGQGNKSFNDFGAGTDSILLGTGSTITTGNVSFAGNTIANSAAAASVTSSLSVTPFAGNGVVTVGLDANDNGVRDAGESTIVFNTSSTGATLTGTANVDALLGGSGNDTIIGGGAADRILAGAGDDNIQIDVGSVSGTVDGGTGSDTLTLSGTTGANVALGANITNIETLTFAVDGAYVVTANNANVAAGQTLTVTAAGRSGGNTLDFRGVGELDGKFNLIGGNGNDTLAGGAGADTITGGAGVDTLTGNGGNDVFNYTTLTDSGSTLATADIITDLNLGSNAAGGRVDVLDLATVPTSVAGNGLAIAGAADLNAALTQLTAGQAGIFTIGASEYLIVDGAGANSTTFTAGDDLVIDVTGFQGTLDVSDFV